MNAREDTEDSYRSLLLLEEISRDEPLSQRDLSKRLGIAVGLVNSYIKNMISRGYIRVSSFPSNRYQYLLTPKGIAEKSRLTYHHLHYFTNLYTVARKDFQRLFGDMEQSGIRSVLFCGVDEVAEIAYLSLQETEIRLSGILDTERNGKRFFSHIISPVEDIKEFSYDRIVITSLKKQGMLSEKIGDLGIGADRICQIGKREK